MKEYFLRNFVTNNQSFVNDIRKSDFVTSKHSKRQRHDIRYDCLCNLQFDNYNSNLFIDIECNQAVNILSFHRDIVKG